MNAMYRLLGIFAVFLGTTFAWVTLGAITSHRKDAQSGELRESVSALWGSPQTQAAPTLVFNYITTREVERTETKDGKDVRVRELVSENNTRPVALASTDIDVKLASDLRRKGLSWYSLYDVGFAAVYGYEHAGPESGELEVAVALPDAGAIYDDFRFTIDGKDVSAGFDPRGGALRARVPVAPGQRLTIGVGYASRGLDQWAYPPTPGVDRLENFALTMHTDFADIDFPAGTMSPSAREPEGSGAKLTWRFAQVVTGKGMGMITPSRIQPGELAAELSWSAPVSLFLFFFMLFVLSVLRDIEIHPINYALIAGAFFAFHLLFAYSADHLPVEVAFGLSSAVSVFLVVSYLRLVVSARFAYVEAAAAQLVYLVGFSLAHFWKGYSGLTATVLSIVTLYLLMQLTGRLRWSELLARTTIDPKAPAQA
jgi:Inner membrane protein CreD